LNDWNGTEKRALVLLQGFMTARELARELGVARVNAYRILRAIGRGLRREGQKLERKRVRQHATGPLAVAYRLVR
jgi:hypothetical protein